MNKFIFTGRLAQDPEQFVTQNGMLIVKFAIAVKDNFNKDNIHFFNLISFSNTANYLVNYFRKGDSALCEGKIVQKVYTNKSGKTIYQNSFIALNVEKLKTAESNLNKESNDNYLKKENNFLNCKDDDEEEQVSLDWLHELDF